jgi:hypothetical protein
LYGKFEWNRSGWQVGAEAHRLASQREFWALRRLKRLAIRFITGEAMIAVWNEDVIGA